MNESTFVSPTAQIAFNIIRSSAFPGRRVGLEKNGAGQNNFHKTNLPISIIYLKSPQWYGKKATNIHITWKIDKHCRNIKQSITIPSLFQQTPPTRLVETGRIGVSCNVDV